MSKRDLFSELSTSLDEARQHAEGKITLRRYEVSELAPLYIAPNEIISLREKLNVSRGVLAHILRTSTRTLESWEQGRSVPTGPAVTLLKLVEQYPDMLEKLRSL